VVALVIGPAFATVKTYVIVPPFETEFGVADSVTDKSAPSREVLCWLALLFAVLESASLLVTETTLVKVPMVDAVITIVTITSEPLAIVPMLQVTVLVPEHVPCVELTETKVNCVIGVSVATTPVATEGPLL
jgi:hypothetical protein